jgi:hypothetical protein
MLPIRNPMIAVSKAGLVIASAGAGDRLPSLLTAHCGRWAVLPYPPRCAS